MTNLILCADDFGLDSEISTGIIELLERNRLSAVSCITTTPGWKKHANELQRFENIIDMGLHFNLTENSFFENIIGKQLNIKKILLLCFFNKFNKKTIADELNRQLDLFEERMKKLPDFIDGHEHIHHLPIIQEALLEVYQLRLAHKKTYIRISSNQSPLKKIIWNAFPKQQIISYTGALKLRKKLSQKGIPYNSSFAGTYSAAIAPTYEKLFPKFLKNISDNGIIMCHPGNINGMENAFAQARFYEKKYFASEDFLKACIKNQITLGRFCYPDESIVEAEKQPRG